MGNHSQSCLNRRRADCRKPRYACYFPGVQLIGDGAKFHDEIEPADIFPDIEFEPAVGNGIEGAKGIDGSYIAVAQLNGIGSCYIGIGSDGSSIRYPVG